MSLGSVRDRSSRRQSMTSWHGIEPKFLVFFNLNRIENVNFSDFDLRERLAHNTFKTRPSALSKKWGKGGLPIVVSVVGGTMETLQGPSGHRTE